MIADVLRRLQAKKDITVYVGAGDGKVRKLNPSDGSTVWTSADLGSRTGEIDTNYYAGWGM